MPVIQHKCEGYDEFKTVMKSLEEKPEPVYIMFSGSNGEDGKSWCPDCVKAKPVIDDYIKTVEEVIDVHFVYVGIERTIWKDHTNPFRNDSQLRVNCVPTLMKWKGPERLEEDECANKSLLKMLFE